MDAIALRKQTSSSNKARLLAKAANNEPKPKSNDNDGKRLANYLNPRHKSYDHQFVIKLSQIRPDWTIKNYERTVRVMTKKSHLLVYAKQSIARAELPINLKQALNNYTGIGKTCYDEDFTNKITQIRPDWFYNNQKGQTADKKEPK
jgi:hypothetical protein